MITKSSDNWVNEPGGFDALNSFYLPDLTELGIPIIERQDVSIPERAVSYTHRGRTTKDHIHFFLDDYRFESVWKYPVRCAKALAGFTAASPDFSVFYDWPLPSQIWNVYRSRWCGSFWQQYGITVVPTISWGDSRSYGFCFDGIETGSAVWISTVGIRLGDRDKFRSGFDAMIDAIAPEIVLCYGEFAPVYGRMMERVVCFEYIFGRQVSRIMTTSAPEMVD